MRKMGGCIVAPLPEQLICIACKECMRRDRRCDDTFTCEVCGRELNVCANRPGGLDSTSPECVTCWERRELGMEWYNKWVTNKGRPWRE